MSQHTSEHAEDLEPSEEPEDEHSYLVSTGGTYKPTIPKIPQIPVVSDSVEQKNSATHVQSTILRLLCYLFLQFSLKIIF